MMVYVNDNEDGDGGGDDAGESSKNNSNTLYTIKWKSVLVSLSLCAPDIGSYWDVTLVTGTE